jgi:hypothetical protein
MPDNDELCIDDLDLHKIHITITQAGDEKDPIETLNNELEKLNQITNKIKKNKLIKIAATFVSLILAGFFTKYTIIKLINILFFSNS